MTDCTSLSERMPDVAHGQDEWTIVEASHLTTCGACALEWRIVQAGVALHADQRVAVDAMATRVLRQLRDEGRSGRVVGSIYWRGGLIGLMTAAASIALVVWAPIGAGSAGSDAFAVESTAMLVLPELQRLSEPELEAMLSTLQATDDNVGTELAPRLGDLTEHEMEQLLAKMEGE